MAVCSQAAPISPLTSGRPKSRPSRLGVLLDARVPRRNPRFAPISVGRHNLFGHPAPTTLRALRDAGARIYRTDRCGLIVMTVGLTIRECP
jgi:beta-lactamase superfamily II metal-dependent hydrolase